MVRKLLIFLMKFKYYHICNGVGVLCFDIIGVEVSVSCRVPVYVSEYVLQSIWSKLAWIEPQNKQAVVQYIIWIWKERLELYLKIDCSFMDISRE